MSGSTASRGYQYPEDGDLQSEFPAISRQAMEGVDVDMASALTGVSGVSSRVDALEGAVGSLVRVDNTAGTAVYLNAGGAEHLISYDSGPRLLDMRPGASGQVLAQRQADRVTLTLVDVTPEPGTFGIVVCDIPSGFRAPQDTPLLAAYFAWTDPASIYVARAKHNLYWVRTITDSSTRPTSPQSGTVTYRTTDSWPTTLPGSPA